MGKIEKAIYKTLLYSDIFSSPLTFDELFRYLLIDTATPRETVAATLHHMSSVVTKKNNYYCLRGRESTISERINQEKSVRKKLIHAKRYTKRLQLIPSVSFIGISGSVASGTAGEDADIDLFIITKPKTIWITRFFILVLLELAGVRRKHDDRATKDRLCVNMLLEEHVGQFPASRQDIYTAREIAQLVTLTDYGGLDIFLQKNDWMQTVMPHVRCGRKQAGVQISVVRKLGVYLMQLGNVFAKQIQIRQIMRKKTKETVTDSYLAFHPNDYRERIVTIFNERLAKKGINDAV